MTRTQILEWTIAVYLMGTLTVCAAASDSNFNANSDSGPGLIGIVRDARTGEPVACRVYVQGEDGTWFFARSADPSGTAVVYDRRRSAESCEQHTTLSAHPFTVDLPRTGSYRVTVERGKEYLPYELTVEVGAEPARVDILLRRWIDMAARGWYSGDTHVHRSVEELPNLLLAEDLNVGLPLSYWVTEAYVSPSRSAPRVEPRLIEVDATHVIWPVNTEYEIFTVAGRRHTLGAVFVLNHREPLELVAPPVEPIAVEARRQGAILDLDKHSWPWSLMLVPIMNVDLFEVSNNHMWRTEFLFHDWTIETLPEGWDIETTERGWTEWGWIDFGFKTWYALLNCGFPLRPTAGTASGVHPVPLGFGRVYVFLPDGFQFQSWMDGLNAGRSFVSTGPMLFATVNEQLPGSHIHADSGTTVRVRGTAESPVPIDLVEIVVNGQVRTTPPATNHPTPAGGYVSEFDVEMTIDESSWLAVRCFERHPTRKHRFAHTAPVHITVPDRPLRARGVEVDYFVRRMEEEIERNQGVLEEREVAEYRRALEIFREIARSAR